jgi:tyrosyl-tRNA synthetase
MPGFAPSAEDLEDGAVWIVRLVQASGCAGSGGEARRLVSQGAVSIDGERVDDIDARVTIVGGEVLKVGKRRFVRLEPPARD